MIVLAILAALGAVLVILALGFILFGDRPHKARCIATAITGFALLSPFAINAATPDISNIDHEIGIAGYKFDPTTTAQPLTVPAGAYHANFTVWGGPVCVSTSATAATEANSDRWPEGLRVEKYNDRRMLLRMTFIKCASGDTPHVQVYFSRAIQ